MKLDDHRESGNVEDRRGGMGAKGTIGIGTIVIALIAWYFGIDPQTVLDVAQVAAPPEQRQEAPAQGGPRDEMSVFVSRVLASTEDTWEGVFREGGSSYRAPKLVLFTGATPSACGTGQAAMGPFYCPGDEKVYIDLSFYRDLRDRFRAPGDFAQAYVIAHEVGHHVQKLLGISAKVDGMRGRVSEAQFNRLSVRTELQADCFAGVWAHRAQRERGLLEPGDLEEGLGAAAAIGDDRLQRQSGGSVVPDSFTHGSSAQRVRWFRAGFDGGSLKACDTFAARDL
ncbi:MAG: neutral zinc metallopeptidase [Burkholderiales bacterium]|nr:neutral zinc metallopeptidase [Burkholderiales bacterium]MBZ0249273.1 neutral zinc metallopeptidase [Burkholderiales bacterium]MCL4689257.1 zinc metallopeptidase [Burkholderiales bacterium]